MFTILTLFQRPNCLFSNFIAFHKEDRFVINRVCVWKLSVFRFRWFIWLLNFNLLTQIRWICLKNSVLSKNFYANRIFSIYCLMIIRVIDLFWSNKKEKQYSIHVKLYQLYTQFSVWSEKYIFRFFICDFLTKIENFSKLTKFCTRKF